MEGTEGNLPTLENLIMNPKDHMNDHPSGDSMAIIASYLEDLPFPATRTEVLRRVQSAGAPAVIIKQFERLEVRTYATIEDLTSSLGTGGDLST